jgi:hypothetical protein
VASAGTQVGGRSASRTRPATTARRSRGRCRRGATSTPPPFCCSPLRHCALWHRCTPVASGIPGRFRPSVLIDAGGTGWLEDEWAGRTLSIGGGRAGAPPAVHPLHHGDPRPARPGSRCRRLSHPGPSPSWPFRRLVRRAHRRHPVSGGRSDRRSSPPRRGWRTPLATVLPEVPICRWPGCHAIMPR